MPSEKKENVIKKRKAYRGEVVRKKTDKTVAIAVTRMVKHRQFGKYLRQTKVFLAHDEENRCRVGDRVKFIETRPMSARKRWVVLEIFKNERAAT